MSEDHVAIARTRVWEQFKLSPIYIAWIEGEAGRYQQLEDVLQELKTERTLDNSVGVQLDRLGDLLGEARNGRIDTDYRSALRVQILVLIGDGTMDDVLNAAIQLWLLSTVIDVEEFFPAAFELTTDNPSIPSLQLREAALLCSMKPVGVNCIIRFFTLIGSYGVRDILALGRDFDGATDRIDFAPSIDLSSSVLFSYFTVIHADVLAGSQRLFSTDEVSGTNEVIHIGLVADQIEVVMERATTDLVKTTVTGVVTVGITHSILVTNDGSNDSDGVLVYVDGVLITSYAVEIDGSGASVIADDLYSLGGRLVDDTVNFDGEITLPIIWNRVIGAVEAADIHDILVTSRRPIEDVSTTLQVFAAQLGDTIIDSVTSSLGALDGTTLIEFEAVENEDLNDLPHDESATSRDFDGIDDHIDWVNPADIGSSSAFSCFYYTNIAATLGEALVVRNTANTADAVQIQTNAGEIELTLFQATTDTTRTSSGTPITTSLQKILVTYDGAELATGIRIFVDGTEVSYGAGTDGSGAAEDGGGTWIWGGNTSFLDGNLGVPTVWSKVLSDTERADLFSRTDLSDHPRDIITDSLVFAPDLDTLVDPVSTNTGVATGTTKLFEVPVGENLAAAGVWANAYQ